MSLNETGQVSKPLVFAHIGDLHITKAKEQNYIDLLSIISQIEVECSKNLDFVVLPGDNADNGLPEQYLLVATALKMLGVPVHIIPGDGSDADSIGAWPENGIFGTQLGPNRNGKPS